MGPIPTGWDPTPVVAGSGSVSTCMATDSRYNHPGQTHSGLPKCDSRLVISAEPDHHHDRVASPGFSKEVSRLAAAPRRPSTNKIYDDRWLRFAHWATAQGFDPLGPTAAQIATFLYDLFDTRGLSPQTLKGYRSCLASVLSGTGKAVAVQAKTISDMITSVELQGLQFDSSPTAVGLRYCSGGLR